MSRLISFRRSVAGPSVPLSLAPYAFGSAVRKSLLIASAAVFLSGFSAASSPRQQKPTEKTSTASHARFSVHPNEVGLGANQSQNFAVTDDNGKTVAVHWKISGVGCSPGACGSIDSSGTYQAPQSLRQPVVVMLEGIPISDSEFPAFARIQLSPGITASHSAAASSSGTTNATQGLTFTSLAPTPSSSSVPSTSSASTSISSTAAAPAPLPPSMKVNYRNGQLTIDATNETLANVLHAVAHKIGATIEVPPGGGLERIVEHAGPAPASDVLTELLKGSRFNFVMIGSTQHPAELEQVLLTVRNDDGTSLPAPTPVPTVAVASDPEPAPPSPVPLVNTGPATMTGAERLAYLRANGFGRSPKTQPEISSPDQPSQPDLGQMIKDQAREIRENASPDTQTSPTPDQPPVPQPQ